MFNYSTASRIPPSRLIYVWRLVGVLVCLVVLFRELLVCWFVDLLVCELVCELVLFGVLCLLGFVFGVLGVSLVHFWELWGCLGFIFGPFWRVWEALGSILGTLGVSWALWASLGRPLGGHWPPKGAQSEIFLKLYLPFCLHFG